jgi:hypothetical protein
VGQEGIKKKSSVVARPIAKRDPAVHWPLDVVRWALRPAEAVGADRAHARLIGSWERRSREAAAAVPVANPMFRAARSPADSGVA